MAVLPVKFRVLQLICQRGEISNEELYKQLKDEYPQDRCVSQGGIDEYLISLKAVALIEASGGVLTPDGRLIQCYRMTARGLDKMEYINGHRA